MLSSSPRRHRLISTPATTTTTTTTVLSSMSLNCVLLSLTHHQEGTKRRRVFVCRIVRSFISSPLALRCFRLGTVPFTFFFLLLCLLSSLRFYPVLFFFCFAVGSGPAGNKWFLFLDPEHTQFTYFVLVVGCIIFVRVACCE